MIKFICVEDRYGAKYQLSIDKLETVGLKHFNDPKAFIEYFNDMDDIYENIDEYHCVKSIRTQSYSGPHFLAFGLNTERYSVSLPI